MKTSNYLSNFAQIILTLSVSCGTSIVSTYSHADEKQYFYGIVSEQAANVSNEERLELVRSSGLDRRNRSNQLSLDSERSESAMLDRKEMMDWQNSFCDQQSLADFVDGRKYVDDFRSCKRQFKEENLTSEGFKFRSMNR